MEERARSSALAKAGGRGNPTAGVSLFGLAPGKGITMQTIETILEEAGGLNAETSVRCENPPFQRLIIEILAECGPDGHRAIFIAHYGELNGLLMRDQEVCAEIVVERDAPALWQYLFQNDFAGFALVSRWRDRVGIVHYLLGGTRALEECLLMWDRSLREKGYLEAFRRSRSAVGGGQ